MKLIEIKQGIPLIGCIAFGIIDRGTNLLQVRCISSCNMKCQFCSTSANETCIHPVDYVVNIDYLLSEVKKVAKIKGNGLIIFLDSVGEPLMHPRFVDLIKGLKKINEVKEVVVITNGVLLTKKKVDELIKAGLDQINLSIHSLDSKKSKLLFGSDNYDIKKVLDVINYISKSKIKLMFTPVYLPNVNDSDIEDIIILAKKLGCEVGLQKYEVYKYSRKMSCVKATNYFKFYKKVKDLENKFSVSLKMNRMDYVEKRVRIPETFKKGDKACVDIVLHGWIKGQMIGMAKERLISVERCEKNIGDRVNIVITEIKNNIYLGK